MPPRDPKDHLPLSPPVFAVLLTLGTEALHGYGIMQALEKRTEGRQTLLPGSLYATIARMVQEGLIEEVEAPGNQGATDRRRRFYRVTPFGRAVASAEAERLMVLLELAREQKLIRGST